jgi:hypothetical protein
VDPSRRGEFAGPGAPSPLPVEAALVPRRRAFGVAATDEGGAHRGDFHGFLQKYRFLEMPGTGGSDYEWMQDL